MSTIRFESVNIGDTLPPLALPSINRTALALFAGASGDHNAIHIDTDYARRAGAPDVFAHGMLSMAYLGRLLTSWVDQRQLRAFGVRFVGITQLGHVVTCTGKVVDKYEAEGERRVRLEVQTVNQYGEPRVIGDAVVAL
ncbi:MaoC family dehydratase [Caballeronia ptereochthonis]|uniref:Bifunctional enoyl-CoA hydratase/phosphate acetyltransferase n=1 Tax=Caballeronia ptereochthonis TaxID=1777144 RepID=A0A157ZE45_9BURK|nr:MaoC family dehydratase [Caballeronia ptereochthonis]SAK43784.1 bifunctional enoyl-CoA hydratase/phosphate acetyltransferase [Caballeronia ptereochthonis]